MDSREILVSCDIGTSMIKVVVCQAEGNSLNVLGVGIAPSNGVKKGQIIDIEKAVQAIKQAVLQAERMVDVKINSVHVGLGAHHAEIIHCDGVVAINNPNREVTNEDKERVRIQAELVQIPQDREIIELIPLRYKVDEMEGIVDPKGMTGMRLEMEGILVTGLKTAIHNTLRAITRAGLKVAGVVFAPHAAGHYMLTKDEIDRGTALIDIGGGTTTVSVFIEEELVHSFVIPIGGDMITKDLSLVLKSSTEDAEKLKIKHGHAFIDQDTVPEDIMVSVIGSDKQHAVTQVMIAEIIEARLTETFELISSELEKSSLRGAISNYVLTGGTMKMNGVQALAEYLLHTRVRTAVPGLISVREPQYTNVIGVLNYTVVRANLDGTLLISGVSDADDEEVENNELTTPDRPRKPKKPAPKQDAKVKNKRKKFNFKGLISNFFE